MLSHPSRVRGLKFRGAVGIRIPAQVAPLAGAWIEIPVYEIIGKGIEVAPLAGAWIEMRRC